MYSWPYKKIKLSIGSSSRVFAFAERLKQAIYFYSLHKKNEIGFFSFMYIKNSLIRNKICLKKKKYKNYSCYTQKRFAGGSEMAIILPISAYYKID